MLMPKGKFPICQPLTGQKEKVIILLPKCNGLLNLQHNQLLIVVTSNDFVTFKIAARSICNEATTAKND
jgi:hypothetical protein